jgi:hypothetical protein
VVRGNDGRFYSNCHPGSEQLGGARNTPSQTIRPLVPSLTTKRCGEELGPFPPPNSAKDCPECWPIFAARCVGAKMDSPACAPVGGLHPRGASRRHRLEPTMHPGLPGSLAADLPQASTAWISDASQCPKIIAPIVKMAVPIQIRMAALFSEMIGVGFMIK